MKKLIYILPVLGLIFTACSDDEVVITQTEATIELSVKSIGFPVEGGSRTVLVATNQSEWEIESNPSWVYVSKQDETAVINAEPCYGAHAISGFVYFRAGTDINVARDSVYVMQSALTANDLSEEGTANCYMVRPNTDYCFDATVKGNGSRADGKSKYIEKYGLEITGAAYADLLWETTPDGDKTRSLEVLSYPILRDGRIYFSTMKQAGNGLIAIKNQKGEILWSWHIWVTEDEVGTSEATIEGVAWTWMDRNLGAMNNTPKDVGSRGMFYQSGRKDPFPPSIAPVGANEPNRVNNTIGKGSGTWDYNYTIPANFTPPANIPAAIRNPMGFFGYNSDLFVYADWYLPYQNSEDQSESQLWGTYPREEIAKTIFDPCPAGYTIPPIEAIAGSKNTPITDMWEYEADENGEFYGWYWKDGTKDFFPFTGRIYWWTDGGFLDDSDTYGSYWTRHSPMEGATGTVGLNMWSRAIAVPYPVVGYIGQSRKYGCAIRCIKE